MWYTLGRYVNLIHKGRIGSAVGRTVGDAGPYSEERSAFVIVGATYVSPVAQ